MRSQPELLAVDLVPRATAESEKTPGRSGLDCLVIVARHHGLHLTVDQLVHDNVLSGDAVSIADLVKCARFAGLRTKTVTLTWNGLSDLRKALPVMVQLKDGGCMVLRQVEGSGDDVRLQLQDPYAHEDAPLRIDRARFEDVWTGGTVLVKRNYDIADESRPFSIGL